MSVRARNAGRIEFLQNREHRLDIGDRSAEFLSDLRQIAGQVAGLVHEIDEILADHAARGIGHRKRQLFCEMVGERAFGRNESFEIVIALVAAGGCAAAPFGIAERSIGRGLLAGSIVIIRRTVALAGVAAILGGGGGGIDRPFRPVGCRLLVGLVALGGAAVRFALGFGSAFQERIALELVVHIGGQVEIRELQQLDGLHQLRRHHKRLALPDFELLTERHCVRENWSGSCLSASRAGVYQFLPAVLTGRV